MNLISPLSIPNVKRRERVIRVTWQRHDPPPHEFVAIVCPEDEGFSVFARNYPGVISQGDTLEEAKSNIVEAFVAMLEARRKHGEPMTYSAQPVMDVPANCKQLRIKVDG